MNDLDRMTLVYMLQPAVSLSHRPIINLDPSIVLSGREMLTCGRTTRGSGRRCWGDGSRHPWGGSGEQWGWRYCFLNLLRLLHRPSWDYLWCHSMCQEQNAIHLCQDAAGDRQVLPVFRVCSRADHNQPGKEYSHFWCEAGYGPPGTASFLACQKKKSKRGLTFFPCNRKSM